MNQTPQPYAPPQHAPDQTAQQQFLDNLPFYRRSGTATALLLLSLVFGFGGPFLLAGVLAQLGTVPNILIGTVLGTPLLAVCVIVLTGDIYFDAFDAQGQPKKWGVGNKVVAVLILFGWLYSIVARFI
jgi:hypothetical protein